jgi:hypothetical protein
MKTSKTKYFDEIINVLKEIQELYPTHRMGQHLSTALDEYGDVWGLSDKEIHFALLKYKAQMELDVPRETNEEYIDKVVKDALNLTLANVINQDED